MLVPFTWSSETVDKSDYYSMQAGFLDLIPSQTQRIESNDGYFGALFERRGERRTQDQCVGQGQAAKHRRVLHCERQYNQPAGLVGADRGAQMIGSLIVSFDRAP